MNAQQTTDTDILQCLREIFPQSIDITHAFVEYVQPEGLKSAYRQRIKENHPDKASSTGLTEEDLTERFRKITAAYQRILPYINGTFKLEPAVIRHSAPQRPRQSAKSYAKPQHTTKATPTGNNGRQGRQWSGQMPRMRLRLGEFLYYYGEISWEELWAALKWQRENRPLIGTLALEWKFITHGDLTCIFKQLKPGERFGCGAVRLGLLTPHQRLALLGRQAGFKHRIGQYFIDCKKFSPARLDSILIEQRRHNFAVAS